MTLKFRAQGSETISYVPVADVSDGQVVALSNGLYGVAALPIKAGKQGELRVSGVFKGVKSNAASVYSIGQLLEYSGGVLSVGAGSGTFRVMAPSPAGQTWVIVEINSNAGGGGGGGGVNVVPTGGTTGQVLKKTSNADFELAWQNDLTGAGAGTWGSITGTLTDQTDLNAAINARQPLDSDLTAIAALATNPYGRDLLTIDSQSTLQAAVGVSAIVTGGTTGQVLAKTSNSDGAYAWTTISGGGGGTWGSITGTLADQADLQAAINARQPLDTDLTAIAALATSEYGRALLTLSSQGDLQAAAGISAIVTGGTTGQVLKKTSNSDGAFAWQDDAGGGSVVDPPGLFPVVATGTPSSDNAAIAAAVASAIAFGDGAIIEFRGTSANREIHITSMHVIGTVSVELRGGPGFDGLIYNNSSAGFLIGGDYYPWNFDDVGSVPGGLLKNGNQIDNPSRFRLRITATGGNYTLTLNGLTTGNIAATADAAAIQAAINAVGGLNGNITVTGSAGDFRIFGAGTLVYNTTFTGVVNNVSLTGGTATITSTTPVVGGWYAFWSDENIADAVWHTASNPMRPLEMHRIARQVIEAKQFAVAIAAGVSGGTYTLSFNALTTAAIAWNANAATIQAAINAVGGLNGNVTVTGSGPFLFEMVGNFRNQHNTASVNPASLTGGTAPRATMTVVSVVPVNKWLIEDTFYDPMSANITSFSRIPTVHGVKIHDINVRCVDGMTPSGSCFWLGGAIDFVIERVRVGSKLGRNNPGTLVTLLSHGVMRDVQIYDFEDPNASMSAYYGMTDMVNNRIVRTNCKFGAVRHGYTNGARSRNISGTDYRYGNNLSCVFDKCKFGTNAQYNVTTGNQNTAAPFDTHPENSRLTLTSCEWNLPATQLGLFIRGRDVTLIDATINAPNSTVPIRIHGRNFTMIGGIIRGGFQTIIQDYGTQPNVDNARFLGVTWDSPQFNALQFETGTGHEVDSCKFINCNGGITSSPWTPSAPIYIKSLTNTTTARIRITNNTAIKGNNAAFVYPGNITLDQLYYAGNIGGSSYGPTSIGIARRRASHGTEGFGTAGGAIDTTMEWEMRYGHLNGHQPGIAYIQKTGHGLVVADAGKPVNTAHAIYDDTAAETVAGILLDCPQEGSTTTNNFYVIATKGSTALIDKALIGGTHAAGVDAPTKYWDLSVGDYVTAKPGDSDATAGPVISINSFTANLCQVTVSGGSGSGGSFGEADLGTFGASWLAAETDDDAMALLSTTPATFPNVTTPPFAITDGPSVSLNPTNGAFQTWTIAANRSPTAGSFGTGQSMLLHVSRSGAFNVTWPSVTWLDADVPVIPSSGAAAVLLYKIGSTLFGSYVGNV